ncbi:hypothetical protein ACHAWU_001755 [Discostella pseudostelligera]|uniref:Uncharacterized protein n=1 Tax=Discostella pseudostelligera TaxID=259834 RepID=A0ABD3MI70_9STRA
MSTSGDDDSARMPPTFFLYNGVDVVPKDVTHVKVAPSVRSLPHHAFANCRDLREVELPEGLRSIREGAFHTCTSLTAIVIPSTVVKIGPEAFDMCYRLESVVLPEGLQTLRGYAFRHCTSLQSIIIPPRIQSIEPGLFWGCIKLNTVILPEALREIKACAFFRCKSLASIEFPLSSLKNIGALSFNESGLSTIDLPDSVEHVGRDAFERCKFPTFRMPPTLTEVNMDFLLGSGAITLELSEKTERVMRSPPDIRGLYKKLNHLRNVAFPSQCTVVSDFLGGCSALLTVFGLERLILIDRFSYLENSITTDLEKALDLLRERFHELPIHSICYFHSFRDSGDVVRELQQLMHHGKAIETGRHQDCLGMNPLHILACSSRHDLEMYRLMIKEYPETLIMRDKWGDIPLLYAMLSNVPWEVIQFFVESYKLNYPSYSFDWRGMLITMAVHRVPGCVLQNLIATHREYFPDQKFDKMDAVLDLAEDLRNMIGSYDCIDMFRIVFQVCISERLDLLNVQRLRVVLNTGIARFSDETVDDDDHYHEFTLKMQANQLLHKLHMFEATYLLELALWKAMLDQLNKTRDYCRMNCGAEVVIKHVLPYLRMSGEQRNITH